MKSFYPLCLHPNDLQRLRTHGDTYKHPALKDVPTVSAVYVLKQPDGTYYVGSTKVLRLRLSSHVYKHPHALFNYLTVPPQHRVRAEEKMIRMLRKRGIPLENIKAAKFLRRPPQPKPNPDSLRQKCIRAGVNYAAAQERVAAGKPFDKKRSKYKQWVEINGRTRPVSFWAQWYKIPLVNVLVRQRIGWSWERAITTPVQKRRT